MSGEAVCGQVLIDEAVPGDVEALLALMKVLSTEHIAMDRFFEPALRWRAMLEAMFAERIGHREHLVLVARSGGRVVGLVTAALRWHSAFRRTPRAMVENLIVAPEYRRQGIATRLIERLEAWCDECGVQEVELSVAVANDAAREFWLQRGYQPVMLRLHRSSKDDDGE